MKKWKSGKVEKEENMSKLNKLYKMLKIMLLDARKKHHEYEYIAYIVNSRL